MAEEACMSLKFVRAAQAPTSAHLYVYPATFQLVNNVVSKIFGYRMPDQQHASGSSKKLSE